MTEPGSGWTSPGTEPTPPSYDTPPPLVPPAGYGYGAPGWYPPPPTWAPTPGVVPLRPLGLGELLDGAIKIVRRYPKPTLGLSAAIAVVVTLLNIAFLLALDAEISSSGTGDFNEEFNNSLASNVSGIPGALVAYLAGLVLAGMLVAVVGRAVLGQTVTMSETWSTVRPRLLALLGLALLTGLLQVLPLLVGVAVTVVAGPIGLLLLLPGLPVTIYLYARLALAPAALVLEKTGIRTSLRRSGVLVRGSWWRVFGILVLTAIIGSVLSGILTIPALIAAAFTAGDSEDLTVVLVATQVASGLASIIVAPFTAGVSALLYVDQRMRKEGLDVALQAAVTASPAP